MCLYFVCVCGFYGLSKTWFLFVFLSCQKQMHVAYFDLYAAIFDVSICCIVCILSGCMFPLRVLSHWVIH